MGKEVKIVVEGEEVVITEEILKEMEISKEELEKIADILVELGEAYIV